MKGERIFDRIQQMIGLKVSPEKEISINQAHENDVARQERIKKLAIALAHSDACPSESEYVLGLSSNDPHPDHAIQFSPEYPLPDLINEEYPLVLKNQEETKPKN